MLGEVTAYATLMSLSPLNPFHRIPVTLFQWRSVFGDSCFVTREVHAYIYALELRVRTDASLSVLLWLQIESQILF